MERFFNILLQNKFRNNTVKSFYVNKNAEFRRRAQNEIANRRQTLKNFHCKLLEGLFVQTLLKKRTSEFQENFPRLSDAIHSDQFQSRGVLSMLIR